MFRLLVAYLVLALAGSWYVVAQAYVIEQLGHEDVDTAEAKILSGQTKAPDDEAVGKYLKVLEDEASRRGSDENWWEFRTYNSYYWKWVQRTLRDNKRDNEKVAGRSRF